MSGTLPKYAEWYYGPQKRLLAYLQFELKQERSFFDVMRITPSYQNIEESRHDRKFNKSSLNHRIEKLDIVSLNADFEKNIQKNMIVYGIEASSEKVNSTAHSEDITTSISTPLDTRYPDGGSWVHFLGNMDHCGDFLATNSGGICDPRGGDTGGDG
jgi:hemoglobin/transferrin/lactoferrin receptor protein